MVCHPGFRGCPDAPECKHHHPGLHYRDGPGQGIRAHGRNQRYGPGCGTTYWRLFDHVFFLALGFPSGSGGVGRGLPDEQLHSEGRHGKSATGTGQGGSTVAGSGNGAVCRRDALADYGLLFAKQPFVIGGYEFAPFGLSIVPFLYGAALLCLIQFVHWERHLEEKGRDRLVDLNIFGIRDFVTGLDVRFIQVALVAGTTFAVPLFLQVTYGISAFETGFILLGLTAGLLVTALAGSKRGLTILPKKKVAGGFLIAIVGILIMVAYMFVGESPMGLIPGLFVYGLGIGLVVSQIVNLIMAAVTSKQTAEASGIASTIETLGSAVGTAVIGTILVVALTGGAAMMVEQSTVFPCEVKQQISEDMATSLEVVSTDVVSENIQENGVYEAEAVRIYDAARQNAFIITLMFMAFAAFVAYLLARRLPTVKAALEAEG
jgi:hypothetical protein